MKHQLSDIDEESRTGICSVCGPTKIKLRDSKAATVKSRYRCKTIYKKHDKKYLFPYRVHKKDYCEHCNFQPVHIGQLDVDHIDGNRYNNQEDNLQTLCANCHRLKTFINKDFLKGSYKAKKAPTQDFS